MEHKNRSRTELLADLYSSRQALERALEQHRAELIQVETLRSANQKAEEAAFQARSIVDSLTEGLVAVRPDGEILYHNKASFALHGVAHPDHSETPLVRFREHYPLQDLSGKPIPPEEGPLARTLRGERFRDWDLVVKCQDTGTEFVGSFSGTPIYDSQGELFLGIVTLRDITEQKQAEENLRTAYVELEKLTGELRRLSWDLDIRQEESRKLANQIHEELGNALAGARFRLLQLRDQIPVEQPELADKAKEALNCLDGLFEMVRQVSRYVRPPVLDQLGLVAAINWLADDFTRKTGIRCLVHADGPRTGVTKESAYASAFYRICQEALSNVEQHSNARQADIFLGEDESAAYLEITDDGQGLDPETIEEPGVGLLNVRERAKYLGGRLEIVTSPGAGTRLRVTVPLSADRVGRVLLKLTTVSLTSSSSGYSS